VIGSYQKGHLIPTTILSPLPILITTSIAGPIAGPSALPILIVTSKPTRHLFFLATASIASALAIPASPIIGFAFLTIPTTRPLLLVRATIGLLLLSIRIFAVRPLTISRCSPAGPIALLFAIALLVSATGVMLLFTRTMPVLSRAASILLFLIRVFLILAVMLLVVLPLLFFARLALFLAALLLVFLRVLFVVLTPVMSAN
jgi:hypothetical protein